MPEKPYNVELKRHPSGIGWHWGITLNVKGLQFVLPWHYALTRTRADRAIARWARHNAAELRVLAEAGPESAATAGLPPSRINKGRRP